MFRYSRREAPKKQYPRTPRVSLPLFYAIGADDAAMRDFLEHWVTLREKDGTMQEFYEHWILGRSRGSDEPRWSILRDVLGWGPDHG